MSFVRLAEEIVTLTYPPAVPKDCCTRFWLRVVSQEPFRIKFHRVKIGTWIMRNLPVQNVKSPRGTDSNKRGTSITTFALWLHHSPDVCDYRGSLGDEISLVMVILGSNVWEPWRVTGNQSLEIMEGVSFCNFQERRTYPMGRLNPTEVPPSLPRQHREGGLDHLT